MGYLIKIVMLRAKKATRVAAGCPFLCFGIFFSSSSSMEYCSDDVCHGGTNESLAQFHQARETVNRGLLRTIQQSSLRGNPPSVSRKTTSGIPSNQLSP
ncbi:unnamed protein product [Protopolystoma xenopodis]|uniref:Uncharacterized protein n=1 Tax=Protopolystoma xenopodis TaxID=117903 RepID=A0A448WDF3_9PLAT|nr:unnamed protein product [Protopolystoma xenopodis]